MLRYSEQIERWIQTFGREAVRVIDTDDLSRMPQKIMNVRAIARSSNVKLWAPVAVDRQWCLWMCPRAYRPRSLWMSSRIRMGGAWCLCLLRLPLMQMRPTVQAGFWAQMRVHGGLRGLL